MIPLLLVSYWLQTRGLAWLSMWGDSAFSVYSANQTLLEIAANRVYDGHPPLYYYLLHFWIALGGNSELNVRLLSVCFGMAMVAAAYPFGRLLGGGRLGRSAAALVALSPELVYYDRLIRMYAGLACLALLSTYLFLRLLRRPGWGLLVAYAAVTLGGLFNHYYAILLTAAQSLFWGWLCLRRRRPWRPFLLTQLSFALLYLPWLAYAAYTQATTTARIISNSPAASGNRGFLEQLWVPFNVGVTLDLSIARPLSLVFAALIVLGALGARSPKSKVQGPTSPRLWTLGFRLWTSKVQGPTSPRLWTLGFRLWTSAVAFLMLAPVALSYVVFLIYPFAVRPRFMLVVLPLYLLLLAWLALQLRRVHPLAWWVALLLVLAVDAYALRDTYEVEAHIDEPDAIQVAQHLDRLAQPGDVVVFHAPWQIGYFESHFRGPRVPTLYLLDVDHPLPPRALQPYRRVWLSMYRVRQRDALYPLEEWLDRRWPKLGEWQFGPNRLGLYARPLEAGSWIALDARLAPSGSPPAVEVRAASFAPADVAPSGGVVADVQWRALQALGQRVTAFLHLTDPAGNRATGHDSEPQAGANPTTNWRPLEAQQAQLGMLVPWDMPPGEFSLELGMYVTPAGSRWAVDGPRGPGGNLQLGRVRVDPLQPGQLRPSHHVGRTFGGTLDLVGYDTDLDTYTVDGERLLHPSLEETITVRQRRAAYRPGETLNLTLYWQKTGPGPDVTFFGHLVDRAGQLRAQHDEPLLWGGRPSAAWNPGELAVIRDAIPLPADLPPGRYVLRVGLYQRPDLQRLLLPGWWRPSDHVDLQAVEVKSKPAG